MKRPLALAAPVAALSAAALSAAALAAIATAAATEIVNPYWSTPVARVDKTVTGQALAAPAHPEIVVSQTTVAVHGRLPVHKHPYQRYVYVLAGTLIVTRVSCGAERAAPCTKVEEHTYKAGDFIAEMRDAWHWGRNAGNEWVKLLVIDQVPAGTASNVVLRE